MKLKYFLSLCGLMLFVVFVIAKNGMLVNDKVSFIFSDDYIFYMSMFFVFMAYYISNKEKNK